MKYLRPFSVFFLVCLAFSQVQSQSKCTRMEFGTQDEAHDLIQTSDGEFLLVGRTQINNTSDGILVKGTLDANPTFSLALEVDPQTSRFRHEWLTAVVETHEQDGFLAVGKTSYQNLGIPLVRFEHDGTPVWSTWVDFQGAEVEAFSIIQTQDDQYAIAGNILSPNQDEDVLVCKVNGLGQPVDAVRIGTAQHETASKIIQTGGDNYFVLGTQSPLTAGGPNNLYLVKLDPSLGLASSQSLSGIDPQGNILSETGVDLLPGVLGELFLVANHQNANGLEEPLFIKVFGNNQIDAHRLEPPANRGASVHEMLESPTGNYILAGEVDERPGAGVQNDAMLVMVDKNGQFLQGNQYGQFGTREGFEAVVQRNNQSLVAVGLHNPTVQVGNTDVYLVETDPSGASCCSNALNLTPVDYPMSPTTEGSLSVLQAKASGGLVSYPAGTALPFCPLVFPKTQLDPTPAPAFKLFPNPAQNVLHLEWEADPELPAQIRVFNLAGQLVYQQEGMGSRQAIELQGFARGLYQVEILTGSQRHQGKFQKH